MASLKLVRCRPTSNHGCIYRKQYYVAYNPPRWFPHQQIVYESCAVFHTPNPAKLTRTCSFMTTFVESARYRGREGKHCEMLIHCLRLQSNSNEMKGKSIFFFCKSLPPMSLQSFMNQTTLLVDWVAHTGREYRPTSPGTHLDLAQIIL